MSTMLLKSLAEQTSDFLDEALKLGAEKNEYQNRIEWLGAIAAQNGRFDMRLSITKTT